MHRKQIKNYITTASIICFAIGQKWINSQTKLFQLLADYFLDSRETNNNSELCIQPINGLLFTAY